MYADYWFYLEPYTFLFREEENFLVYNSLNGAYIDCSVYPATYDMLNELYFSDKNYSVGVCKERLKERSLQAFIRKMRDTFSGDILKNTHGISPFVFKPLLRLYSHPGDLRVKQENLLGLNSLLYLHDITFFLENKCGKKCIGCNDYYKQFPHCTAQTGEQIMKYEDYANILEQLELCQLDKVRLIPGEQSDTDLFYQLIDRLKRSFLKKEIVFHYTSNSDRMEELTNSDFFIKVLVHFPINKKKLDHWLKLSTQQNLVFVFIISKEEDLIILDQLNLDSEIDKEIFPFYDGENTSFFEKFVYTEWSDILENPVNKQTIFRRQVLNENFFGKLYLFPTGEIYSNVNYSPIGNITKQKLTEIVYQEISNSRSWLLTRANEGCKKCINKYLCPSPNNYEIIMNKFDLCHINK